jgi:hypothetical protein
MGRSGTPCFPQNRTKRTVVPPEGETRPRSKIVDSAGNFRGKGVKDPVLTFAPHGRYLSPLRFLHATHPTAWVGG